MKLSVKEVCKEKGLTIQDLADKMEMKRESLSRAINGNPTLETLEKIASALGVDVPELFTSSSSGGIIGVIRIRDTNYNINSVSDLSRLLDRIESGEIVL
ncbi:MULTISPECIES: helix-turn-helix domain-containing protein [Bacteroidaceae]|jgi:Predicted transcriptional regulator|uniref:Helix-turn-helix domain-containing protein n=1 Tax=Bacteroides acidifaciens TaxID=85831 RepID=A0A4S2AAL1_9BACE|nr:MULTISPECIES: helix-turn-helix transcriptional regulator [Bacteroidaceae]MBF0730346.1 helix-turn-helix domain-containing protein [Bacteroides acidifaciens]MBF0836153.1 helix-turn-helix domain-containing protein [Bacteroides acidifaciens]MCR1999140.1 helix-turn-helix domain-containing protein [Bacteroides acidifaciens]NDO53456.1 helix-turn-helix domain-containing protein [Bacteroides acidifaciens]TFU48990.1 helix-turn-helix domain-containing protein [Bacteroides acidifaciens]